MSSRVPFRIACCLCGKNIPLTQDIYALDQEWERRYPAMLGTLACPKCALTTSWSCTARDGSFVDGHIPSAKGTDFDAWSHILGNGTHRAMVLSYPRSGLLQGAEAYLRTAAERRTTHPKVAAQLRAALHTQATSPACSDL
ncbi:hypothetical protein [Streptomyces cavernae]|uniref:hypothetical protein n=1 Tax=Streptomyces cavernae TaxID=2259034 RepID=UPI000FEC1A0D|nr:hypothetical protein [Streptomyces cavernae]